MSIDPPHKQIVHRGLGNTALATQSPPTSHLELDLYGFKRDAERLAREREERGARNRAAAQCAKANHTAYYERITREK